MGSPRSGVQSFILIPSLAETFRTIRKSAVKRLGYYMMAIYNHIHCQSQQQVAIESNIILSTNKRRHRKAAWSRDQKDALGGKCLATSHRAWLSKLITIMDWSS